MGDAERIVLDDIKMNLVGALMTLVLAATFTGLVELPFRLVDAGRPGLEEGRGKVRHTRILIRQSSAGLVVSVGEQSKALSDADDLISTINPSHV